ncbi:MAG: hypothetical protein C4538_11850 [Nitrospiraceae bacterium]|nr:MAG: hypothetical protein C4538_11850 [Nitrospiraceae bacterium]
MSNLTTLRKICLVFFFLAFQGVSASVYSFTSQEEYLSHVQGPAACVSQQCHEKFTAGTGKSLHEPVDKGICFECHRKKSYSGRYGIDADQRETCTRCHNNIKDKIESSTSVHSPIMNGSCTSCHDPHQSAWTYLLKQSYSELCSSCHKATRLFSGVIHKPVRDGNCGICHDPHASNYKHRLVDAGVNLCFICHKEMVQGMSRKYIHAPIIQSGCSACHDPHSGNHEFRLKTSSDQLCFTCHEATLHEIEQSAQKHEPARSGKCTSCHSPHYSESRHLLLDSIDTLCYRCHKESSQWKKRRFLHGPVAQGNCVACHNPHGSDNAFILRLPFPGKFYAEYKKGVYNLCFLCHKESLMTLETTETVTRFRNGPVNLHRLHVYQQKGRTCRACHDVHASDQDGRIRDEFPFGQVSIRLEYKKTKTGGSCLSGCHKERSYDRVNRVLYEK